MERGYHEEPVQYGVLMPSSELDQQAACILTRLMLIIDRHQTANIYGFEVVPHMPITYAIRTDPTFLIKENFNPI